ncbi:MAG: glycosyltransferase, partial [Gammaproteobacteria bacterium]|nr:glycosyltransferase [Gammaproteobacteria bacterium]
NAQIIVVDDGSTDDTGVVAAQSGAKVIRLDQQSGQSVGRNIGVANAEADIVMFVDSDVVVAIDSVEKMLALFRETDPEVSAAFGAYDDSPDAPGLTSQYRNLLHHFTHQVGARDASTFWSGCGAIRREVFEAVGGFNEDFYNGRVEDIELGYRLKNLGHRIALDPTIQGKHLKAWTLWGMVKTDVFSRAIPWTRLLLEGAAPKGDLNTGSAQKLCVAAVLLGGLCLVLSFIMPTLLFVSLASLALVLIINRDWFGFLARHRGLGFMFGAIPLHVLYYAYSGLAYAYVWLRMRSGWGY